MSTLNILSVTLIALILAACAALFLGVQAASAEGDETLPITFTATNVTSLDH